MLELNQKGNEISLTGVVVAGAISVAASGGTFDLTDTAVGIILLLMIGPALLSPKKMYIRLLFSTTSGMCLLLVFGVLIEILSPIYQLNLKHQFTHFIFWLISSVISYQIN